jgi:hypothetical protein
MTMIDGPRPGHCGKPRALQCRGTSPGEGCACKDDVIAEIIAHGSPIDYGPDYSPPPTPSPGSSGLDARP